MFVTTVHSSVTQLVYPDDRYDGDDDCQEVSIEPPHSVLDVYRQTLGESGSRRSNVLDQLTT